MESRINALAVLVEVASWRRLHSAARADHAWPEVCEVQMRSQ